jgi:excisionase family DNA binding protein
MTNTGKGRSNVEPVTETVVKRRSRQTFRVDPHVASVPVAANMLGISKDLAYDLARRGELPGAFQLGRRWLVSLIRLRAAVHGTEDDRAEDVG